MSKHFEDHSKHVDKKPLPVVEDEPVKVAPEKPVTLESPEAEADAAKSVKAPVPLNEHMSHNKHKQ